MTASKALESATSLAQYCLERYEVELTKDQLYQLIGAYSIFDPVDVNVWLKIRLMQLKCFPCGYTQPPSIHLSVTLHIDISPRWGISPLVPAIDAIQECKDRFRRVIGLFSDRHRARRSQIQSDEAYHGYDKPYFHRGAITIGSWGNSD